MADYEAKRALERLHRELMEINPSAARSLAEGLEKETLTVHKLGVPAQLRRTPCCTNVIESAFSIVETACRNVKTLAARRPDRTLDRLGVAGCRASIPEGNWPSPDSPSAVFDEQCPFQKIDCERSRC